MFRKLQDRLSAAASAAFGTATASGIDTAVAHERLQALGPYTSEQIAQALLATSGNVDQAAEILLLSSPNGDDNDHDFASAQVHQQYQHYQNEPNYRHDDDEDLQRALQQSMMPSTTPSTHFNSTNNHSVVVAQQRPDRTPAMNDAAAAAERRAAASKPKALKKPRSYSNSNNNQTKQSPVPSSSAHSSTAAVSAAAAPIRVHKVHKLQLHHPDVKLIPQLRDKSVEEQVVRTADRMKHHPAAVDALHRALSALYQNPDGEAVRRIDTNSPGFVRSVAPAPGALDFLRAMRFDSTTSNNDKTMLILHLPLYDPALVYLGLTALEQTRTTLEYQTAKEWLVFAKEMTAFLTAPVIDDSNEATQRKAHSRQCPTEPTAGRGALLQIQLLPSTSLSASSTASAATAPTTLPTATNTTVATTGTTAGLRTIRRRFDSDDTVEDVLSWIGAAVGTEILSRLQKNTWCLVNINHSQRAPIQIPAQNKWTLQFAGCWPSGRLVVQPSSTSSLNTAAAARPGTAAAGGDSHGLASGTLSDDE